MLRFIDGRPLSHDPLPKPEELAYTWDRCAFTEAIKCAPTSPRSQPLDPMFKQCPDFLLTDELRLLKPGVVLLLGRSRLRDEVRPLLRERLNLQWGDHPGRLEWDRFEIDGSTAVLFCLNHPSGGNPAHWQQGSFPQLVDALPTALASSPS